MDRVKRLPLAWVSICRRTRRRPSADGLPYAVVAVELETARAGGVEAAALRLGLAVEAGVGLRPPVQRRAAPD